MSAWEGALGGWALYMRAAGRPATTIYLRVYQLRRFAEAHPDPGAVVIDDVVSWLAGHDWRTETRRSYRSALRAFFRWAHRHGHLEHNPADELPPIRPSRPCPRPAPVDAIQAALTGATPRERLMLLLAARQGLRRGEIARVHSDDLQPDVLGWSLRVHGKGGKTRVVPLDDDVARVLRSQPTGWVFPGRIEGHLSPAYVGKLVSRRLGPGWTAHTLRHRFATAAYTSGDLFAVQDLLGHESPETTRRYVALPQDAMRRARRTRTHPRLSNQAGTQGKGSTSNDRHHQHPTAQQRRRRVDAPRLVPRQHRGRP